MANKHPQNSGGFPTIRKLELKSDPLPMAGGNPYLAMLDRVMGAGGDVSQIDKLLDLQIRWEQNEARKAFVEAMAAFKADGPMVIEKAKRVSYRNSKGTLTEYNHAELSDCTEVIVPRLAKHGFSHAWNVAQDADKITVSCTLTHRLGHSESVTMTAPPDESGGKNTIQAIASTTTYLQRYTFLANVGAATGGQDDDGRGADDALDPDQEWIDAIEDCTSVDELKARKRELVVKVGEGDPAKVPSQLQSACARKMEALLAIPQEQA